MMDGQEILKSSPPISKKSPKYADHPRNAGHGFAALEVIDTRNDDVKVKNAVYLISFSFMLLFCLNIF